jgi:uncharacterized membrane protein YcjF (UPF0283 family)
MAHGDRRTSSSGRYTEEEPWQAHKTQPTISARPTNMPVNRSSTSTAGRDCCRSRSVCYRSSAVAAAAYKHHQWVLSAGVVGVLAIAGGIAWLVVEHHRVLRIEQRWLAEHPEVRTARSY